MKKILIISILFSIFGIATAQNEISNVRVQVVDTIVVVTYDLEVKADIEVFISFNNGNNFMGPLKEITGAVGKNIMPEKNKMLMWNVVKELGYVDFPNAVIKVTANPVMVNPAPVVVNKVPETPKQDNSLYATKRFINVYYNDRNRRENPLGIKELRSILANNPSALEQYNKGVRQYKSGKGMSIAGIPIFSAGAYCTAMFIVFYTQDELPLYPTYISGAATILGGFLFISGSAHKKRGNRNVAEAVDIYNRDNSLSQVDLKVGFTGNGLCLRVNF